MRSGKAAIGKTPPPVRPPSSFADVPLLSRKRFWLGLIAAVLLLAGLGWIVGSRVETALKETLRGNLNAILRADVEALTIWFDMQKKNAKVIASDEQVRDSFGRLVSLSKTVAADSPPQTDGRSALNIALLESKDLKALRSEITPRLREYSYFGFAIADRHGCCLAAMRDEAIGQNDISLQEGFLDAIYRGDAAVTRPFLSKFPVEDDSGQLRTNVPTMLVGAPIRSDQNEVIGALVLRIRPEDDFTEILTVARAGESGETYAFDESGLMLSESRFDDQLKQIGLLVDREGEKSVLNIEIRDPGVDMVSGDRPALRRSDRPLTHMAADAVQQRSGIDVDGYRSYRGVPVVGAWTWLPEYSFGVATEIELAEAYRPLRILRFTVWALFALLVACFVAIVLFTVVVGRLRQRAAKASIEARELGQYTLDQKIGSGAMGVVYRAHHGMLQRPTAVKLLELDKTSDRTIARFEREVQLTSQLNHPNTIAIYDYGRTPEGIFYYAMEYLDGLDLQTLVDRCGAQPEGRVIHILRQICGSLNEAHGIGLIHRDIKPANIILCQRGGEHDVVKVLDFGLVKAVDEERQIKLTATGVMLGTPLYMSPEAIQRPEAVDGRNDLYAVGAVGYFMITGVPCLWGPQSSKSASTT